MARQTDGQGTLIEFASDPTVLFEEVSVTPPSIEGGGEINITNHNNTTFRTKAPKTLVEVGPSSLTVQYDPATLPEILGLVNVNTLITLTFPDGSTWKFFGWLDSFTPGEQVDGEQPTAEITIIASMQNALTENTISLTTV
jgi:hypothetical protein